MINSISHTYWLNIQDDKYMVDICSNADIIYLVITHHINKKMYNCTIDANVVEKITKEGGMDLSMDNFLELLDSAFSQNKTEIIYLSEISLQEEVSIRFNLNFTITGLKSKDVKRYRLELKYLEQSDADRMSKMINDFEKSRANIQKDIVSEIHNILSNVFEDKKGAIIKDLEAQITPIIAGHLNANLKNLVIPIISEYLNANLKNLITPIIAEHLSTNLKALVTPIINELRPIA